MTGLTDNGLVSIITPLYNSAKFIAEAIQSVLAQTFTEWEIIIVDDCSTDNSVEIVDNYQSIDSRIKLIRLETNSGPAIARNRAIEEAKGRYIAFLDSDDTWLPQKLEKQISFMKENKSVLSYAGYQKIDENGNSRGIVNVPLSVNYDTMLDSNYIPCLTAIYDSFKLGKIYMPNIMGQDYGLWLKILKMGHVAYGINEPLAYYRERKKSFSSNKLTAARHQWKVYREVERLSLFNSVYHFMKYSYIGLRKYRT